MMCSLEERNEMEVNFDGPNVNIDDPMEIV